MEGGIVELYPYRNCDYTRAQPTGLVRDDFWYQNRISLKYWAAARPVYSRVLHWIRGWKTLSAKALQHLPSGQLAPPPPLWGVRCATSRGA